MVSIIPFDSVNYYHRVGVATLEFETFPLIVFKNWSWNYSTLKGWVVVEKDGTIIGCCLYDDNPSIWYFSVFAVSEKYRRNGYGSAMLKLLIEIVEEARVSIDTRAFRGDKHLVLLYQKFGFEVVPGRENSIGSPYMIRI